MRGKVVYQGAKKRYFVDGAEVTRQRFERAFPPQPLGNGSGLCHQKPKLSDALAVHPDLRDEAIADARAKGVPTEFAEDGRPLITSRAHQKAYLKAYGFRNRDGGYGD